MPDPNQFREHLQTILDDDSQIESEQQQDRMAPFRKALDYQMDASRVMLKSSLETAKQVNPDTRARAMELAKVTRLPVDIVESNLDEIAASARSSIDVDALRRDHPDLATWLEHPDRAAISHDDLPVLRQLDVAARALRGDDPTGVLPPGYLFQGDRIIRPIGDGSQAESWDNLEALAKDLRAKGERSLTQEIDSKLAADRYAQDYGWTGNLVAGAGQSLMQTQRALGTRTEYDRQGQEVVDASVINAPGWFGDVQRGIGGLVADAPLMLAGAPLAKGVSVLAQATRMRGAMSTVVGRAAAKRITTGLQVAAASQPLAAREGVTEGQDHGAVDGALAWLVESAVPGAFGRTGVEKVLVPGATGAVADGWRGAVKRLLVDAGMEGSEEAVTEFAHAVREYATGADPTALDADKLLRRLSVAGTVGAAAGGAFNLPVAVAEKFARDGEEARRATVHAERLDRLVDVLAQSKTNGRAPDEVKAQLETTLGQENRHVFVDAEQFRAAFEDPAAAAAELGIGEEYTRALATGGQVQVPTVTLLQKSATDEQFRKLIPNTRRTPEAQTATEGDEYTARAPEAIRQLQAEAKAATSNATQQTDETAKQVAELEQNLTDRLSAVSPEQVDRGAIKRQARIVASAFGALAKRTGKTPQELFTLKLRGDTVRMLRGERFDLMDAMIERLRKQEIPSEREAGGMSLVDFLRTKGLADKTLAGELKQLAEDDRTRKPGERNLVRGPWEDAQGVLHQPIDLDTAAAYAHDRGYIDEATPGALLDALNAEISGSPVFSTKGGNPQAQAMREALSMLDDTLRAAGVDINASNQEIRKALADYEERQGAQGYNQAEPDAAPMADTIEVDGKQRPTLNSNGKRIAQDEESVRNFWRWFGDSKVVDEQGRPLVVYHGSPKQFDVFDTKKIGQAHGRSEGAGFYFTTSKETAASYAEGGDPMAVYLQIDKPIAYNAPGFKPAQIKKALLAAAKIESEREGSDQRDGFLSNFGDTYTGNIQSVASEAAKLIANDATAVDQLGGIVGSGVSAEIVNEAVRKSLGFDGYVSNGFSNEGGAGGVIWVATAPTQIKSATSNAGTFDPSNPSILGQGANTVTPKGKSLDFDALLRQWRKATGDRTPIGGMEAWQQLVEESAKVDQGNGTELNQPAYHGTPHKFDKFTTDHMGTGEGAQAFGWGLYFAGRKEVAEWYRESIQANRGPRPYRFRGVPYSELPDSGLGSDPLVIASRVIREMANNDRTAQQAIAYERSSFEGTIKRLEEQGRTHVAGYEGAKRGIAEIDKMSPDDFTRDKGLLYSVEIPEDGEFLQWDKPANEQPAKFIEAANRIAKDAGFPDYKADNLGASKNRTGQSIYADLGFMLSPKRDPNARRSEADYRAEQDKRASLALLAAGVKGIKYLDGTSRADGEGSFNYVIFDGADVAIKEYNQPGKQEDRRGSIKFNRSEGPGRAYTISLFRTADVSTFLHESGHLFLEMMGDLSKLPTADQSLKDDAQRVLDWLGAKDFASITEDQHETFARGFERYLFEGVAPASHLREAFARIKAWMVAIYRTVANLNVELTPEIRGVFDRLVAAEDSIDQAEAAHGMDALLPPESFPSLAEWERYREAVQASRQASRDRLEAQLIDAYQQEATKAWKAQHADIEAEVAREVDAMPVYQAMYALQRGTLPDGTRLPDEYQGAKLDKADLVAQWGEAVLDKLPGPGRKANAGPYLYAVEGGLPVEQVARMWGFPSGDALVESLIQADDHDTLIQSTTDKRMKALRPDPMTDGTLTDKANAALATDQRAEVFRRELSALGRRTGQTPAPVEVLRQIARDQIARTKVYDLAPDKFRIAAAKAARRAMDAASRQQWDDAYRAKTQEALNLELFRAARDAKESGEAGRAYLRTFDTLAKRQEIGKAGGWDWQVFGPDDESLGSYNSEDEARKAMADAPPGSTYRMTNGYLEQIFAVLDGYKLRRLSNLSLRRRQAFRQWYDRQMSDDSVIDKPNIDERVIEELVTGETRNWNELTTEEQASVVDAVRSIETMAKLKNKLLKAARLRALGEARDAIVGGILKHQPNPLPDGQFDAPILSGVSSFLGGFNDAHQMDSFLARGMDGDQDGGPLWESFIRPRNEAAGEQESRSYQFAKALDALYKEWGKGSGLTMQEIPGTKLRLTTEQRIALALNWGHKEGRHRVMLYLGRGGWNAGDAQAVLDSLDAKDWKLANGMLRLIETLWPEALALERRSTGTSLDKVQALPFVTKAGAQPGGYFPIKYDPDKSKKSANLADMAEAKERVKAANVNAQTRRSHTKVRMEEVQDLAIRFDFGVLHEHISEVIHDITHREMIRDQNALLRDDDIRRTIINHHGQRAYQQLSRTVNDIATGGERMNNMLERAFRYLRINNSAATFALNLTSALQNFTGFIPALTRIGPHHMMRAVVRLFQSDAHTENGFKFAVHKSDLLANRSRTLLREAADATRQISPGGKLAKMRAFGWWPMYQVQRMVDTVVWLGAYEKALSQAGKDLSPAEADSRAVAIADQTIVDTQGSGRIGDLPAIMRGGELQKLATSFFSYFAVMYNLERSAVRQWARSNKLDPMSYLRFAGTTAAVWTLPAVLTSIIKSALQGDKRDDEERWSAETLAREQIAYGMGMMVLLREAGGLVEHKGPYRGPAGLRGLDNMVKLAGELTDDDFGKADAKAISSAAGTLFGLPAVQVNRLIDAIAEDAANGKEGEALRRAVFGAPRQ